MRFFLLLGFFLFGYCKDLAAQGLRDIGSVKLGPPIGEKIKFTIYILFDALTNFAVSNENGEVLHKTYYLSMLYKSDWMNAFSFCKANGMGLATFNDENEMETFLTLCNKNLDHFVKVKAYNFGPNAFIGGSFNKADNPKNNNMWYWLESGKNINFNLTWSQGEPNNYDGDENCLGVTYYEGENFGFNDVPCFGISSTFICQDVKVVTS